MDHEKETGIERRNSMKFAAPEQVNFRTILGSKADHEKLKTETASVKEWMESGDDEYKVKFESYLFLRSLFNYLKDNEIVNFKDYTTKTNKKTVELIITKNKKVQKKEEEPVKDANAPEVKADSKATNPEAQSAVPIVQPAQPMDVSTDKVQDSKCSNTTAETAPKQEA